MALAASTGMDLGLDDPEPAAGLADGSTPTVALTVGSGPGLAGWVSSAASAALPPPSNSGSVSGSARVWILPPIPTVSIASNVLSFDPSMTPQTASAWARYMVRDLIIESEARRSHDLKLAESVTNC